MLSDPRVRGERGGDPGSSLVLGQLPADPCHSAPFLPVSCALIIYSSGHRKKSALFRLLLRAIISHQNFPRARAFFFFASSPSPRPRRTRSVQGSFARAGLSCLLTSFFPSCPATKTLCLLQPTRASDFISSPRSAQNSSRNSINHRATSNFFMPVTRGVSTHGPRSI